MSGEVVYRSMHPDVLAAFYDWQRCKQAAVDELRAIEVDLDPDGKGRAALAYGGQHPRTVGLKAAEGDDTHPPAGWKYVPAPHPHIAPHRRSKAGKEAYARLMAWTSPPLRFPGMPRESWVPNPHGSGHKVLTPGCGVLEGVAYARWDGDADLSADRMMSDGTTVDASMWGPCPLSEFYAVAERNGVDQ